MPNFPITTAYQQRYLQQPFPQQAQGMPGPMQPGWMPGQMPQMPQQGMDQRPAWAGGPMNRTAAPPGLANQGYTQAPGLANRPPMPQGPERPMNPYAARLLAMRGAR